MDNILDIINQEIIEIRKETKQLKRHNDLLEKNIIQNESSIVANREMSRAALTQAENNRYHMENLLQRFFVKLDILDKPLWKRWLGVS